MKKNKTTMTALMIGALGVVFGDIGTSPLYTFLAIFGNGSKQLVANESNIYGVLSLVAWSVMIVVSIKYISFLMRIDNDGEGGVMALVSLIKKSQLGSSRKKVYILLGIIGVSLFYGDSAITPAISVLSAVEGLRVAAPQLSGLIVPITLIFIGILFGLQRFGTAIIGRMFGSVMLVWFTVIAMAGGWQVWNHPAIITALSPTVAVSFFLQHPVVAFLAMGFVVLAITGAEALYAGMGHFGRKPISRVWFMAVFPSLLLCYMGQGVVLLKNPQAVSNPFYYLFPEKLLVPVIALAALATLIASQSVISGAFSLTRQAVQLGFLPNMLIKHTSVKESGQVYVPLINSLLLVSVVVLVLFFRSADHLANAYGVAISGALFIDTVMSIGFVASYRKGSSRTFILLAGASLLVLDIIFVAANVGKITSGGWFPLAVASVVFIIITTWLHGQSMVAYRRMQKESLLQDFADNINKTNQLFDRLPGQAVYIAHHPGFTPLALQTSVDRQKQLYEKILIVVVNISNSPYVPLRESYKLNTLKYPKDNIYYLELTYGYNEHPNVPRSIKALTKIMPEFDFDIKNAQYFVSLTKLMSTDRRLLSSVQRRLYLFLRRNQLSQSDHLSLPINQTIDIESIIKL